MIDETLIELLSKSLDQETTELEENRLTKALSESAELRGLKADLLLLRDAATPEIPACSQDLRRRIEVDIAKRYPRPKSSFIKTFTSPRWFLNWQ